MSEPDGSEPLRNVRWEGFCQNIAKGMTKGAAYSAAGYTDNPSAASTAASRLFDNVEIVDRIRWLQADAVAIHRFDMQKIIVMLMEDRERSHTLEQMASAVRCTLGIAQLLGIGYAPPLDRVNVEDDGKTIDHMPHEGENVINLRQALTRFRPSGG